MTQKSETLFLCHHSKYNLFVFRVFLTEITGEFCELTAFTRYSFDDDRHFTQRSKTTQQAFSLIGFRKCGRVDLTKHFLQAIDRKPEAVSLSILLQLYTCWYH